MICMVLFCCSCLSVSSGVNHCLFSFHCIFRLSFLNIICQEIENLLFQSVLFADNKLMYKCIRCAPKIFPGKGRAGVMRKAEQTLFTEKTKH